MYNIYSIVILILFDIPRFSVNYLHQIQVAAPSPSSRKSHINDLDDNIKVVGGINQYIHKHVYYVVKAPHLAYI